MQQLGIAAKCEILARGFARMGIIALVTRQPASNAIEPKMHQLKILEGLRCKGMQPWVKTFSDEYYGQLFRLRGLEFPRDAVKRPQYFGTLTNDIVYKRLAPGVLEELKKVIPKTESGRRADPLKLCQKLHQKFFCAPS